MIPTASFSWNVSNFFIWLMMFSGVKPSKSFMECIHKLVVFFSVNINFFPNLGNVSKDY